MEIILNKEILVTGSQGFIGKHLCPQLYKEGYGILEFDKVNDNDISKDINDINDAISNVSRVVHLAGIAHMPQCHSNPLKAIETNIIGTANVLEACIKYGVHLTYISSQYVFSRDGGIYRCTKKACEDLIKEYHKQYGLQYTIVRCGSVYGVGADEHNFIHNLIKAEIENIDNAYSNGTREYIHVKDVVKGILKTFSEKFINKSILLAGIHPHNTWPIIAMIKEILNKPVIDPIEMLRKHHYKHTPYAYEEIENEKLILDSYVDLGAGILEIIKEMKCQK